MRFKLSKYAVLLGAFCAAGAIAQTPVPQQPSDRTGSPYDRNPACRDRDVASTDPACVIQDGQPPRQSGSGNNTTQTPAQSTLPNVSPAEGNRTPTPGSTAPVQGNASPTTPSGVAPSGIAVTPPSGGTSRSGTR